MTSTYDDLTSAPTGLYVYGVVVAEDGRVPEGLTGIDGAAVELVQLGDVAAAVSVAALERPPGRRAELVAHRDVVDALAASGAVVPVQFGAMLADPEDVVQTVLGPEEERFAACFPEKVRGDVLGGASGREVTAAMGDGVAVTLSTGF